MLGGDGRRVVEGGTPTSGGAPPPSLRTCNPKNTAFLFHSVLQSMYYRCMHAISVHNIGADQ